MSDLLQSQIYGSCKLAMPEGLKELMSDISREVLRAQPENLYQFITDYLEALLDARETLSIACRVCGEICSCTCTPELEYELQCIGLSPEDVDKAKKIIEEHFDKGQVKESNLLIKLARKTSVTDTQLSELKKAIHKAYQRHVLKRKDHQVSFGKISKMGSETSQETSVSTDLTESSASDFYRPSYSTDGSATLDMQTKELCISARNNFIVTESATTLAGSYINLPLKVPYSAHQSEDNVGTLLKKHASALNILKTLLYTEGQSESHRRVTDRSDNDRPSSVRFNGSNYECNDSENYNDNEDINDTIESIVHVCEAPLHNMDESQHGVYAIVRENLDDSSSGSL